jgi:L-ascorbate metabolism protein UlaG (beta-lactamase superfamily)
MKRKDFVMKTIQQQIVCLFILFSIIFVGQERVHAATTSDSLKYLGHSFVKIKTSEGKVLYIDPYNVNEFADSADVILVTHEHSDHNDLTRVKQKASCAVIRSANALQGGVYQSFTIGNIKVKAVAAYNANHAKSSCVGYIVEFNGIKLYHAGDTGNITELTDLTGQYLDYALLPMEGTYTVTPEVATQMAAIITAKHDIPIHTMAPPDTYSDAFVARFTSPNKLVVHPGETIALVHVPTGVIVKKTAPSRFELNQNYPNPFNPSTRIEFSLPGSSFVSLKIYNMLGKEVSTLISENLQAGNYSRQWNAISLSSGIYFYQLQAGKYTDTKKLILIK